MGDIADMMIDGVLDMHTGEYIGSPCGYPRTVRNKFVGLPSAGSFYTQYEKYRIDFLKSKGFEQQDNGSWLSPSGEIISNKRIHNYLTLNY